MSRLAGTKRAAADVVDLTEDGPTQDDCAHRDQRQRHEPHPWSTQMVRDDANAEVEHDGFDDEAYQRYELYGTLSTKVVGVRYYDGTATAGEFVTVRREPSNPYDHNAMRIDNVMGQQIGHIGRTNAAKIAPLMDNGSIVVEGQLTGEKGPFDMPIGLKLYGSGDAAEQVAMQRTFRDLRLPLDHLLRQQKERQKAQKEQERQEKERQKQAKQARRTALQQAAKGAGNIGGSSLNLDSSSQDFTSQAPPSSGPSMQDVMAQSSSFDPRRLGSTIDQLGSSEDQLSRLPLADQPPIIATKMLPYQRQGLAWLIDRENPRLPASGSKDTVQLWQRSERGNFTNIATNYSKSAPELASGGILADDMGLGKTLQIISLIAADPKKSRHPTLIVAPLGVMSNWAGQAEEHVSPEHKLKVLTYHGAGWTGQKGADFEEYDIVVTNYETLATEYMPGGLTAMKYARPLPRSTGLLSTKWRRVVLDEGHHIRNSKAKKAMAAFAVSTLAQSKWVLTGTPIVNTLKDLQSLIQFIGLKGGLESLEVFSAVLLRPFKRGQPEATLLLQALMSTICLRRMKDMKFVDLRLPDFSSHKYPVAWEKGERDRYEAVLAQARGMLQGVMTRHDSQQSATANTFSHLLEILLRLRQVCNHWALCKDRVMGLMNELAKSKTVAITPENKKALQDLLQVAVDSQEDCAICMSEYKEEHAPVITTCAHVFGESCITQWLDDNHTCPMCRAELGEPGTCLVEPAVDGSGDAEPSSEPLDASAPSSKIKALISILQASAKKNDGTKTVIFSQWTTFLSLLQPHLMAAGMRFCRLDGSMKAEHRDGAIAALNTDPECTILLASLSVCSVGLNLCSASQVIMADSWWSPAVEDQAVDRVYRLGQTRPVNVWRLVMEDSIEERVLDVQADKRQLVQAAFGEGAGGKRGKERVTRLADIERLLR